MAQRHSSGRPHRVGGAASTPVAAAVEHVLGCKWSVRLLGLIAGGCTRPGRLLRACPGLSAKVMHERLRRLTAFGILQRTVRGDRPPLEVDYLLTPFGIRFLRILDEVRRLQEAVDRGEIGQPDAPCDRMPVRRAAGGR
ncbi:MAG TPA: winged helix-turn-helix transcriptional regulator [Vicinamibacterales bacterium]|nr:winged helix-turn-helix transcriptional regulator [Vicinamibacterales bacterium]